ncbi:LPXTG-motif cell wall anchor domain protein [Weissella oryzae SG25]|uniref:LPXTG-motif cell wall anchor domain protein n=1 Tax=Weissella oryzae (strain DSM 25784 / JCM 18191 / LMG 30913 / SG25) TaxID=1329250 RepID=A0A069CRE6_WEIOS|nr:Cna B-type domain-containing protein [Weissella oryzae]GAK30295.1 LPXTG-motif cell wall anchor domain protein [Weissella oryzae SG25]
MKIMKKVKGLLGVSLLVGATCPIGQTISATDTVVPRSGGRVTTITKDNFLDEFTIAKHVDATHPSAQMPQYDASTGILTLTPNLQDQSGSATLNHRVSLLDDFTLKGAIYLGDKLDSAWNDKNAGSSSPGMDPSLMGGGDGIGFAFHPGAIGDIGYSGANMGIGGLKNAFGYKFDTFYNLATAADPNGKDSNHRLGWEQDPTNVLDRPNLGQPNLATGGWPGSPFGAFVKTNGTNGFANHVGASVEYLDKSNILNDAVARAMTADGWDAEGDADKGFIPITFSYLASNQTIRIDYNGGGTSRSGVGYTDTLNVSDEVALSESFALAISAGTGAFFNLQQFKIESFSYTAAKEMSIQKNWLNDDPSMRPANVIAQVLQKNIDGESYLFEEVELTANNNWQATLTELPEFDLDGHELEYIVLEVPVPGYEVSIDSQFDSTYQQYNITLTNRAVNEDDNVDLTLNKIWRGDEASQRPAEIFVELYRNGELLEIVPIVAPKDDAETNQWTMTLTDLLSKDVNGQTYLYTIKEQAVENYQSEIKADGTKFTITNTLNDNGNGAKIDDPDSAPKDTQADSPKVQHLGQQQTGKAAQKPADEQLPLLDKRILWALVVVGAVLVTGAGYMLWRKVR